ncbi:S8 family serine peptidase [Actinomadura algeriensis]|uniref:Type VII secretion-associated serine protease mycosin n=1 Tax=Actinomadura algeriensis TaxID=1679523 RepID=A0ABR9JTR7_9ACTN|nr:S8 family serine peptidase [Actinomadura algeriensis]MBE1533505.1 type VII secretion-associated serine protease mycosin [Actinomadura algeriensis]
MSQAGRHRSRRARPALRPRPRSVPRPGSRPVLRPWPRSARTTAALTIVTLAAAATVPVAMAPDGSARTPRPVRGAAAGAPIAAADQIRAREWHLETVRAERAWKWSTGQDVTVAVLDTGVDANHPDLVGSVVNGPDLTGGGRPPGSRYWGLHGTSMASIIAGHGHGRGSSEGIMGVAPQSRVLSIRVTLENDDPLRRDQRQRSGDGDAIAQGIRYAVDHGADIINMSLGGGQQYYNGTPAQASAIRYALDRGVVLIASAGNDGSTANRKNFPAAYPGVIAVGALDRRLRLWEDSNRHSHVSVCAPGVDIVSADNGKGYVVGTGTSASSAIVAGIAALVRARYPKLTPDEVRRALVQGSPARAGHPTGFGGCRGTVDAVRTLIAAHGLNKVSTGPVQTPTPAPAPEPVAEPDDEGTGVLLPIVLGGGGVLLLLGVTLGWRQRGRREDDEPMPEYGLSGPPPEPAPRIPPPAPVASGSPSPGVPGGAVAPVNAPLWQNNQVQPPPGYADPGEPVRFEPPPVPRPVPVPTPQPVPGPRPVDAAPPRRENPPAPRPSAANGHDFAAGANFLDGTARESGARGGAAHEGGVHGAGAYGGPAPSGTAPEGGAGANGAVPPNGTFGGGARAEGARGGAVPNGTGVGGAADGDVRGDVAANGTSGDPSTGGGETGEIPIFDDEAWERFRRSALEGTGVLDAAPRPAVPTPLPSGRPEAVPGPANPGESPQDGPGALPSRSPARPPAPDEPSPSVQPGRGDGTPGEDEEYRPPWW